MIPALAATQSGDRLATIEWEGSTPRLYIQNLDGSDRVRVKFDHVNPVNSMTGGGPIFKNKTWFFIAFEEAKNTSPQRQTNFAWQLMAGVTREVGNGLLLDVGYRYVDLGDVSASSPGIGHAFNLERLTSHEVKIGLRIPLWLR